MIVAIGQMIVMLSGGIDLSVASIMAFSGLSVGLLMEQYPWIHPVLLVLLGIAIGFVFGFVNGFIIGKGKVPPIIATLGTLSIYRGLAVLISRGTWVDSWEMTQGFKLIARGTILGINNLIFFAIVLTIIFIYFTGYAKKGREIYAYGSNNEAARFAGINPEKVNYLAFSISGLLAGLGGILYVSRVANAQSYSAQGFEMQTIAVCVIGGVSIFGGIGTLSGVIFGVFLWGVILNAMNVLGVSDFWQLAVQGLIVLIAVIIDTVLLNLNQEQLRRSRRVFGGQK
jgi:rhamnose transport system permease protein